MDCAGKLQGRLKICWSHGQRFKVDTLEGRAPPNRDQTGGVNELAGTSQSSTKANAESCSWDGMTPHNSTGWHSPATRHLEKEDLRALVDKTMNKEERAANLRSDCIQDCIGNCITSRSRELFFPLCLSLVRSYLECYVSPVQVKYQNIP